MDNINFWRDEVDGSKDFVDYLITFIYMVKICLKIYELIDASPLCNEMY